MVCEIDPRSRDNPEAAMVHAHEVRSQMAVMKRNGHAFGGPQCFHRDACAANLRCVMSGACEPLPDHAPSAALFDLSQAQALNRAPATEAKPEAGTLPGFDSAAHRSFMRSLG